MRTQCALGWGVKVATELVPRPPAIGQPQERGIAGLAAAREAHDGRVREVETGIGDRDRRDPVARQRGHAASRADLQPHDVRRVVLEEKMRPGRMDGDTSSAAYRPL